MSAEGGHGLPEVTVEKAEQQAKREPGPIDSNKPDVAVVKRRSIAADKAKATNFDTEVLFSQGSTYRASAHVSARLRSIAATNAIKHGGEAE